MTITEFLEFATKRGASDTFIVAGRPLSYKKDGKLIMTDEHPLKPEECKQLVEGIYELAKRPVTHLDETGDDDFSFSLPGLSRFRASAYMQRGSMSAVIRIISFGLPNAAEMGIPRSILDLGKLKKGMVLITGPAGSGKSTTLACIIDEINRTQEKHIITLEDPLEYLHRHQKSIISQREINTDAVSYVTALKAALRQSPDVILLGEIRDLETISIAVTAAETGHLVFSTLHTLGAANTIDRMIDVFPPNQQKQITVQLAGVLQAVVSQQLVPAKDGGMAPAFELMTTTPAIRNMIREGKIHQIDGLIYSSAGSGMFSMDSSLQGLYRAGRITREDAIARGTNPDMLAKKLL